MDHTHDRAGANIPVHDREVMPDRDVGYFRGGERGPGYERVHIDHIDISRPPPPLPVRGGAWPAASLESERLPSRGSTDRLDDYHREVDQRHDRGHGLLRPPPTSWDRTDRGGGTGRGDYETAAGVRYSHDEVDRREGLLPVPSTVRTGDPLAQPVRAVKTEDSLTAADRPAAAAAAAAAPVTGFTPTSFSVIYYTHWYIHKLRIRDVCLKFVKIREFYEILKIRL